MFPTKFISSPTALLVLAFVYAEFVVIAQAQIGSVTVSCDGGDVALGMGDYFIEDSQISAYHAYAAGPAASGRIVSSDNTLYWAGKTSDSYKWFQVDLLAHTVITGLVMEGRMDDGETSKRVLTYSIEYSSDGSTFVDYEESGSTVVFDGNTVEGSTVTEQFSKAIVARTIRMNIITFQSKPSLRLELQGCYQARSCLEWAYLDADYQSLNGYFWSSGSNALQYYDNKYNPISVCYYDDVNGDFWDCTSPLGVGNGYIDDSQMSASSTLGSNYAWNARFDDSGVWMPSSNAQDEWLEIDFTTDTFISGFKTRGDSQSSNQLDSFLVTYSTDGSSYDAQTEFAEPQVIDQLYLYQSPMTARYLKFTADTWTNNIALAVEVYGCGHHVPTAFPTVGADATSSAPSYGDCDGKEGYFYIDEDGDGNSDYTYCTRMTEYLYDTCYNALGMEDYTIADDQITTSSESASRFGGQNARLNVQSGGNGWKPATQDANQWLLVDLGTSGSIPLVTGVGTQSRGKNHAEFVTSLKISHSVDGLSFTTIQDDSGDRVFNGNTEYGTVKYLYFDTAVHARFVRFEPQTYSGALSMRVEVYGCRNSLVSSENVLDESSSSYGWYYTSGSSWDFKTTIDGSYVNQDDLASLSGVTMGASSEKSGNEATEGVLDNSGCWVPSTTNANEWLQFDFTVGTIITKIDMQGHHSSANKYVESYNILHAMSDDSFTTFQYLGSDYLFIGNDGSGVDVISSAFFNPPLIARYVRIAPQSWGNSIGLRVALYGVQHSGTCREWEANQYNAVTTAGYYLYTDITDPIYCPIDNSPDYSSCQDYYDAGFTDDHYYILNPSGGSYDDTIFVHCDFTSVLNNNVAMVTVSSDLNGWNFLQSYVGNYSSSVTYSSNAAANVGFMAAASDYCYQYMMYECFESRTFSGSLAWSYWQDKDENQMPFWPGNEAESTACYCNELGNCAKNDESCHCSGLGNWYSEGGWITNKDLLPIGGLYISDISDGSSSGNFTIGDLMCFTKSGAVPSSCYDVAQDGHSTNGLYLLKLSTGDYIPVYCDFNSVENAILTRLGHDFQEPYDVSDYKREGRFARDINYDYAATITKAGLLVDGEDACRQKIEFTCYDGALLDPIEYSWLGLRNGSASTSWAGTSVNDMCPCGALGSCYDNSQSCNCDGVQTTIHEDNGWVTDRTMLPLKQMRVGGIQSGETATVKVSKLECFKEESGALPPSSCYEIKQNGDSIAGNYLIDPDGSGGEEPFIVYCDPSFNSTHAQMIIHHDSEDRSHVVDKGSAGEYQKMVTYDGVTIEQFTSLFSNDINVMFLSCVQEIKYECYASTLLKNNMGWFVDRLGASRTNFGVANDSISSCPCGVDGTCSSASEVCNCDNDAISWAEDTGDINDFHASFLPVTQLRFGDTSGGVGNEEGYHTLGPLICSSGPSKYG
ncbi:uncharacterized protein LOC121430688 [Lytechinus variegatus]|uniref:uncharacterized protein LOC121430688 n=1 Tax=Lytechinus variegatus TaxID=7654 RepID=UPI001BB25143|nr:uncharacterized protein LOC121430688 [Lytechinus variegatus]